jgi:hypothetical protein
VMVLMYAMLSPCPCVILSVAPGLYAEDTVARQLAFGSAPRRDSVPVAHVASSTATTTPSRLAVTVPD